IVYAVSYEIRPRVECMAEMRHASALDGRRLRPIGFFVASFGDDSSRTRGHDLAQRQHLVRIERHSYRRPGVGGEYLGHPSHQLAVAVEMALHLDDERHAAI